MEEIAKGENVEARAKTKKALDEDETPAAKDKKALAKIKKKPAKDAKKKEEKEEETVTASLPSPQKFTLETVMKVEKDGEFKVREATA